MIANAPLMLIVLMVLLTLLGGAIGYCIALLKVKKSVQKAIHAFRLEQDRLILAAEQKRVVDDNIFSPADFMQPGVIADQRVTAKPALLTRNAARNANPYDDGDKDLRVSQPHVLSQRIGSFAHEKNPQYSTVTRLSLDFANATPTELDIPAIAESELPDDVDELDFKHPRLRGSGVKEGA